jgi:polar amino acid transport system ATP-binding protein
MSGANRPSATEPSQPSVPALHASRVHKSYGDCEVLKGVSLEVTAGQVMCIIGPSGSGKSTFLRCINHLESIDSGRLLVFGQYIGYRQVGSELHEVRGKRLARQRRDVGMVFQQFGLFPHRTAIDNIIEAPLRVLKQDRKEAVARAEDLLRRVGLLDKRDAYPAQLSGGQQQRVAIARALAMRPKLLLFDEPTSALDPELVNEVLNVIRELAAGGMSMVVVTHEMAFARELADIVTFMDDGVVVESGPPAEVMDRPRERRTRAFLDAVSSR